MKPQLAENYGWESATAESSHSYLLPPVLKAFGKYDVKSLLDIGTGNGATLPIWISKGLKVSALEPDVEGFGYASKHSQADVRQLGVGESLPTEWQGAFDAAVSLEVIEHLFNPHHLVATAKEALRKNGIIIISTPYHGYIKNLALAVANKWDFHHHPARIGGHIKFWSRETLNNLFINAGFEEVSFHGAGRLPFLWKSMIIIFRKK